MTIGFVLDDTLDKPDGVQHQVLTIGEWMRKKGHDVHYIVAATTRTDIPNVHPVSRFMSLRFNGNGVRTPLPASRGAIKRLLSEVKFDIVYVQMPFSPLLGGKVVKALPPRTRVIGTFHIAPYSRFSTAATRALGLISKRYMKYFDNFTFVSEAARDFARKTYHIDGRYIPNCVDASRLSQGRRRLKYKPHTTRTIVFLGRLVERKGVMELLKAIFYMRSRGNLPSDVKVIIGGKGPLDKKAKDYVIKRGLSDTVEFIGFVDEAHKADLLKSADIAVFPASAGESFGIVLIEAMASGAGVVLGGDNPGYRQVLRKGPDNLFAPKNTMAFARLLSAYLTDPAKAYVAHEWQQKNYKQYDVATVARKLLNTAKLRRRVTTSGRPPRRAR